MSQDKIIEIANTLDQLADTLRTLENEARLKVDKKKGEKKS